MGERARYDEGAVPRETNESLISEVNHIRVRQIEDRADRERLSKALGELERSVERIDERLRRVSTMETTLETLGKQGTALDVEVRAISKTIGRAGAVVGSAMVGTFLALLALLFKMSTGH